MQSNPNRITSNPVRMQQSRINRFGMRMQGRQKQCIGWVYYCCDKVVNGHKHGRFSRREDYFPTFRKIRSIHKHSLRDHRKNILIEKF